MAWRGRSRDWAERKVADYYLTKRKRQRAVRSKPKVKLPAHVHGIPVIRKASDWKKVDRMVARRSVKKAVSKGAVHGAHAAGLAFRVGTRAIPFVGWALLAYDAYTFGSWLSQKYATVDKQADDISPYLLSREEEESYIVGFPHISIPDVAYA
jgi:hypothetical protein